jgi:hypothetical protein
VLSDNKRLSLLIRKNNGRRKLDGYKQFFKGFNLKRLEYIDLEQGDKVREQIKNTFAAIEHKFEMINNGSGAESALLSEISNTITDVATCYIFTDDVEECGMFKTSTKSAIKSCLDIAFLAYNNTCFFVDYEFKYSFTINYNDDEDRYYPNTYEIFRKIAER